MKHTVRKVLSGVVGILLFSVSSTMASYIDWNTWTSGTTGLISTASGPVGVQYIPGGTLVSGYPTYAPATTFADGTVVQNAPTAANGIMQIWGGSRIPNLLLFTQPIVDPVFTIWSLGQNLGYVPAINASFDFFALFPQFVAGGPNAEYGGTPIQVIGSSVFGQEGNGTIQFLGTYNALAWTNPTYEYWYGFNVGAPAPVPEPGTVLLLGAGMLGLAIWRKRRTAA